MKVLIIFLFIFTSFSGAQTIVLNQDYYSISKNNTVIFKQNNDTLTIAKCIRLEKCDTLRKLIFKIEKDSVVNKSTKIIFVKALNKKAENNIINNNGITLVQYDNGRIGIRESYNFKGKEKIQHVILYPKSELENLKPISKISKKEGKEIFDNYLSFINSINDEDDFDFENYTTMDKFTELVIKKGYNPIGAYNIIGNN
ncbi:hypothetical protein [Psychroserpens mesophilus]|uniref:hypothetical protein n=1 Tax=Psychroserpens mesophilus TaxID=325473 RepID=UPI00058DF718|nr:hypothetical protein [Psychroserpens mesophilus]